MNLGQLAMLLRAEYLVDAIRSTRARAAAQAAELAEAIATRLRGRGLDVDLGVTPDDPQEVS